MRTTIRHHSSWNTCRNFYEKFKVLSLKMKAWQVSRRRGRGGGRRRRRREGEGRRTGREGKADCKSCSLLLVADNSFYNEVISITFWKLTNWKSIENIYSNIFGADTSTEFLWKFKNLELGMCHVTLGLQNLHFLQLNPNSCGKSCCLRYNFFTILNFHFFLFHFFSLSPFQFHFSTFTFFTHNTWTAVSSN